MNRQRKAWLQPRQLFITPAAKSALHPEDVQNVIRMRYRLTVGEVGSQDMVEISQPGCEGSLSQGCDRHGNPFWIVAEENDARVTVMLLNEL